MATTLKKTDVVIIGLGAAGGVACLPLAQAGLEVIGLEAGSWLSTKDMAPDELKLSRGLWPPGPQKTKLEGITSRANASQTANRVNHPMMNAVGGTSVHYMAQSWRLNPWDFKVRSETIRRYGAARIPKGSTIEEWPLTYEELEPYYDHVEYEIGVSGKAGNIGGKTDERGNVFEGARKREYPMPALRTSGYMEKMVAAGKSLGWHPFIAPAAITSKPYEGRPGCSKSKAFPNGLTNNHTQVGKHYFSHNQGGAVSALFPFNLNNWYGTPGQGIAIDNWADDNFDHSGLDFIGGGNLYVYTERRPIAAVNGVQAWMQGGPNWGSKWKAFVKENADRSNTAYLQKTTLPYEDNYLDLDPAVKDPAGFPVIRITAEYKDNERKIGAFVAEKMKQWYMAAGAIQVNGNGNAGGAMGASTHAYGGTRMGNNPETNVVDKWGFSHEAPNLGILGGSVMGTSGARNPTQTIQALAWRTAEHLVKNWKSIAG